MADGPSTTERPVVSNTTPLITLAGVGLLDLLPRLYGEIWMAEAVHTEYQAGARATDPELEYLSWARIVPVAVDSSVPRALGAGEAATISLAIAQHARVVLLDERLGRRIAAQRGLPVVGTLAVLLRAKREGVLPAVGPVIEAMLAQGRHISTSLREDILRAAGELLDSGARQGQ